MTQPQVESQTTLVVHRRDPSRVEVRERPPLERREGRVRVAIRGFGLSANNLTYAALGEQLPYFDFFPADAEWSALPVWGVGTLLDDGGRRPPLASPPGIGSMASSPARGA